MAGLPAAFLELGSWFLEGMGAYALQKPDPGEMVWDPSWDPESLPREGGRLAGPHLSFLVESSFYINIAHSSSLKWLMNLCLFKEHPLLLRKTYEP